MTRALRHAGIALLAALAGCAQPGPQTGQGWVSLPPDATIGAGDPTRAAIINTAYVFGTPSSVAGRPADAARAVAELEYLATEIPTGPRWREFDPTVALALQQARHEERAALDIAPQAPPQAVIDALFAASRALRAGDTAAVRRILSPPVFPNGALTLQRLASLPPLPIANQATSRTAAELDRMDRMGESGGPGGTGGGGGGSGRP